MTNRIWKYSLAAALAAVVLAVVGIACAAEEPADPQQPAAARAAAPAAEAAFPTGQEPVVAPSQEQQQPAQAAPARAPSLPNPAQAAAAASGTTAGPTARTGEDPAMVMAMEGYMPPKLEPGAYPATRFCDHCPTPKQFNESPTSASLARQGAILPLEQRLAVPEDVLIYMPGDEIGQYGGQMRATTRGNIELIEGMTMMSGLGGSPDAIFNVPVGFKAFETNEDATVFTINIRRGMRWHSGYPFTMEDIRFALEDQMLNKELMPGLPAVHELLVEHLEGAHARPSRRAQVADYRQRHADKLRRRLDLYGQLRRPQLELRGVERGESVRRHQGLPEVLRFAFTRSEAFPHQVQRI